MRGNASSVGAKCMSLLRSSIAYERTYFCDSLQEVDINPQLAVRNHDRANCFFIEISWPRAADDGINITQLAQTPQTRNQERRADPAPAFSFAYTRRAKEGLAGAFVSGETNHL